MSYPSTRAGTCATSNAGETIEVTDRGRSFAHIVPNGDADAIARLTAAGRRRPALRAPLDSEPLPPGAGVELPSETLLGDRAHER